MGIAGFLILKTEVYVVQYSEFLVMRQECSELFCVLVSLAPDFASSMSPQHEEQRKGQCPGPRAGIASFCLV